MLAASVAESVKQRSGVFSSARLSACLSHDREKIMHGKTNKLLAGGFRVVIVTHRGTDRRTLIIIKYICMAP